MKPTFSICIPNYNYGAYLGETIDSILNQTFKDFEICIADNASTDNSWEVIQNYCKANSNIKAIRNTHNLGFAGNLDVVSAMVEGSWIIMLSSDDLMNENALEIYYKILSDNNFNPKILMNSGFEQFENENPSARFYVGYKKKVWQNSNPKGMINSFQILEGNTGNLLKNGFEAFASPFNFLTLCYSAELYRIVNGYGSARLMNPDKWFHWKLCSKTDAAIFVDGPLFYYRWHNSNQTALQEKSGVLKYWLDEYRNCFELSQEHFEKSGVTKGFVETSFFNRIIVAYGLASIIEGKPQKALRIFGYGLFTFPNLFFKNYKSLFFLFSMILYPFTWILSKIISIIHAK